MSNDTTIHATENPNELEFRKPGGGFDLSEARGREYAGHRAGIMFQAVAVPATPNMRVGEPSSNPIWPTREAAEAFGREALLPAMLKAAPRGAEFFLATVAVKVETAVLARDPHSAVCIGDPSTPYEGQAEGPTLAELVAELDREAEGVIAASKLARATGQVPQA